MRQEYYAILLGLEKIAEEFGENEYLVLNSELGVAVFKNGKKVKEVGTGFVEIARYLLDEAENNFNDLQYIERR